MNTRQRIALGILLVLICAALISTIITNGAARILADFVAGFLIAFAILPGEK